jgi:hypothetical protein
MIYLLMSIVVVVLSFFVGFSQGKVEGLQEGRSTALKTNPPSEELELACAGLWVGEQNRKYYEKKK